MSTDAGARVRAAIARAVLGEAHVPERLGEIQLRPHQLALSRRAALRVATHRGVLIAEPPGWGKTFVALAVAHGAERLVVIAPAALRDRWTDALARTRLAARIVGVEWLSRACELPRADWVIVDESHHVRNPATQRYAAAARLTGDARVILLTATPVQNALRDLAAQLALFLGEGAYTLDAPGLATHVLVSGSFRLPDGVPTCDPPRWIDAAACGEWLDAILRLPPAVPPADGGDGGALLQYALARQWASSRGALVSGLRRRLATAGALRDALEAGRHPSKRDLALWSAGDDAMQLAFPELVADAAPRSPKRLLAAVRRQERAVRSLLDRIARAPDPDRVRADALAALLDAHPHERIVAFTGYAETVRALARHLRAVPGVAWLTAAAAHTAGGRISRRDVLRQLVPGAEPPRAERIRLLVTTDVLSEGLDLHAASVVVHLDLPWNPARLEQRVGRVARIGAPRSRVAVYAFRPPAPTERLLRVQARLRAKLAAASRALGHVPTLLPVAEPMEATPGAANAQDHAAVAARLERWIDGAASDAEGDRMACVAAPGAGWLAAVATIAGTVLVADLGGGAATDAATVARATAWADGPCAASAPGAELAARRAVVAWLERERGAALSGGGAPHASAARRVALLRCARIVARSGPAARARIVPLVAAARRAIDAPGGVGTERRLAALTDELGDDAAWLEAVARLNADAVVSRSAGARAGECADAGECFPLILFVHGLE